MTEQFSTFQIITNFLFPELCLGCRCLLRHPDSYLLCSRCRPELQHLPPNQQILDHIAARFAFHGPLALAIRRLKFESDWTVIGPLSRLMIEIPMLEKNALDDKEWDLIIPVPLHISRLLIRGYNQSLLLTRSIMRQRSKSGKSNLPRLDSRSLIRCRNTPPQQDLDAGSRWKNVKNAFSVPIPRTVVGKSVLLVDDVTTTGATLSACRSALLSAGAKSVGSIALLRTLYLP